jgi:inner membrane protein YidH
VLTALAEHCRAMRAQDVSQPRVTAASDSSRISTELSSRRTGLSFQRTRLSAERTLMSVIRTALSLIGFGFTIHQLFTRLAQSGAFGGGAGAARIFGTTLVLLGVVMLALGIYYHVRFILGLRATGTEMTADGLLHGQSGFPPSLVLVSAVLLLLLGLAALGSMLFQP